jgi:hypothetical protein
MEAVFGLQGSPKQIEGNGPDHQSATNLCVFSNRASLEAAFQCYIADGQLSGALIERIGD